MRDLNHRDLNKLKKASRIINIKTHIVHTLNTGQRFEVYSPCDLEGECLDTRLGQHSFECILNFLRKVILARMESSIFWTSLECSLPFNQRGYSSIFPLIVVNKCLLQSNINQEIPCSHLFRLFRPEFIKRYPIPLCSDGFSGFIRGLPGKTRRSVL